MGKGLSKVMDDAMSAGKCIKSGDKLWVKGGTHRPSEKKIRMGECMIPVTCRSGRGAESQCWARKMTCERRTFAFCIPWQCRSIDLIVRLGGKKWRPGFHLHPMSQTWPEGLNYPENSIFILWVNLIPSSSLFSIDTYTIYSSSSTCWSISSIPFFLLIHTH